MAGPETLEMLFSTIEARKGASPETSYTAKLFAKGPQKIAEKLGEEAIETVIAAVAQDKTALTAESADLIYHLLVLWAEKGIQPSDVWAELERRTAQSGLEEKNSRPG